MAEEEHHVSIGVSCPYSGFDIKLTHVLGRGWVPDGGFIDPTTRRYPTRADAVTTCLMRGGERLPRDTKRVPKCPYTGTKFEVSKVGDEWVVRGTFKVKRVFASLDEAKLTLGTRGGKKPKLDKPKVRVLSDPIEELGSSNPNDDVVGDHRGMVGEKVDTLLSERKIIVGG